MSRPHPALFRLARGDEVERPGDPVRFVASALEHRLGGLVLDRALSNPGLLPPDQTRALAIVDLQVQAHHARLTKALTEISAQLREIGVESIAMKGVAAEARWYSRVGQRPCTDIDLLIPANDDSVGRALRVLSPGWSSARAVEELVRTRQLQHVDLPYGDLWVDLHFDPLKLGIWTRSIDPFFAHSTPQDVGSEVVQMLAPEHELLGFLTHLNKDRFCHLGRFLDVAHIVKSPGLDWDLVEEAVAAEGLEVPVHESLALVCDVLGIDVPLAPGQGIRNRAWRAAWPASNTLVGDAGRLSRRKRQLVIPLLAKGRGRDALRELRRNIAPPAALLDAHSIAGSEHSRLRRLTVDRLTRVRSRRGSS